LRAENDDIGLENTLFGGVNDGKLKPYRGLTPGNRSIVRKDWAGKGDKSWRPVWLLKPAEWKSLSLHDRAIYLMAYAETVYAATRRAKDAANQRKLDICIASVGIEGLISSMEQTKIEWQFPLPWSVSRAFGSACKDRR
jgi:hypothetical protein